MQTSNTMKIMGNAFNGAKEFYYTDWQLQYTAGSARWFPEFTPVNHCIEVHVRVIKTFPTA